MSELNLRVYDLVEGKELPSSCAAVYRNTMLGHLFPDVDFMIGDVGQLLSNKNVNLDEVAALLDRGFGDYRIVGASGSRKSGRVIFAKGGGDYFTRFFGSNMNAINYGSNLTTECRKIVDLKLRLLVVNDGEWNTGDCHGKGSDKLCNYMTGSIINPFQFRAVNESPNWVAKGTIAHSLELSRDGRYDLVLPLSCFKGNKVTVGSYALDQVAFGLVFASPKTTRFIYPNGVETPTGDWRQSNLSYSVVQFLPWEAVEADILPLAEKQAQELNSLIGNPQALGSFLLAISKEEEIEEVEEEEVEEEEYKSTLAKILEADFWGQLASHPWVVKGVQELFAKKWLKLATSGGIKFRSSLVMPDEDLQDDTVCIPSIPAGEEIILFPYPCRWKYDIKVYRNMHLPAWKGVEGVIILNTQTAMKLGRDFDGDHLMWYPAKKLPNVASAIRNFGEPPINQAGIKPKKFPLEGTLGQIAVKSMKNDTGIITYMIAVCQANNLDNYIAELVVELQAAVDSLKGAKPPDQGVLERIGNVIRPLVPSWLRSLKKAGMYSTQLLPTNQVGTVGKLVAHMNGYWIAPSFLETNPRAFMKMLSHIPIDENRVHWAEQLAKDYAQAFAGAGAELTKWQDNPDNKGKKAPTLMVKRFEDNCKVVVAFFIAKFQEVTNPEQRLQRIAALWQVKHRANSLQISAGICFVLGVDEIVSQLRELRIEKLSFTRKYLSPPTDKVWQGEQVGIRLVLRTGEDGNTHYFCETAEGETLGCLLVKDCPPILVGGERFSAYLHSRKDKSGNMNYLDAVVSQEF